MTKTFKSPFISAFFFVRLDRCANLSPKFKNNRCMDDEKMGADYSDDEDAIKSIKIKD